MNLIISILVLAVFDIGNANPFLVRHTKSFSQALACGEAAINGEFPHIVQINRGGAYCAGSILNENWIVTVAHCSVATISGYQVIAGAFTGFNRQLRNVSRIVRHPNYNSNTLANDIAVWRLSAPLVFDGSVSAVAIAETGNTVEGPSLVGKWEGTSLVKLGVEIVASSTCKSFYGEFFSGMVCTKESSCCPGGQGASGSPLVQENTLIGLYGWGYCAIDYPVIYTDISYYSSWITSNVLN